jgi:hypothetical protein
LREQCALAAKPLFEPLVAALGVTAVTRQMAARKRVCDICELAGGRGRFIEWDLHGHPLLSPRNQQ